MHANPTKKTHFSNQYEGGKCVFLSQYTVLNREIDVCYLDKLCLESRGFPIICVGSDYFGVKLYNS